jgi:NMD protein affecting ribosome stability and mRNA decay
MGKCIKCGKTGEFRLFCESCYLKDHPLMAGVKLVEIKICPVCGKFLFKNKWKDAKNPEDAISETIIEKIEFSRGYEIKDIGIAHNLGKIEPKSGRRLEGEAILEITACSDENKCTVTEEYFVPFDLLFTPCGNCGLQGTKYFQGTLQIRSASPELTKKIEEYVKNNSGSGSYINNTEETRDGVDYYMTSNHALKNLGKNIQKKFGGEIEVSPRLQGRDGLESKDLYRLSVLLRFSDVSPGDFVEHQGRIIHIKKTGKEIIGRDIIDNTNVKIDPQKHKPKPLTIYKTVITKVQPQIEAMNPINYQSTRLENPKKQKLGQKIEAVVVGEKLFIVNTPHQN